METSGIGQTEIQGAPRVLPLGDLCIAAGIPCPAGAEKLQIHGITAASARVRPGWLFAALPGSRTDGRQYIPDALRAGAVAVLYPTEAKAPAEDIPPAGTAVGIPLPPDAPARAVFARLVSAWYGDPGRRLHLVGVTGTNGKTTVQLFHPRAGRAVRCSRPDGGLRPGRGLPHRGDGGLLPRAGAGTGGTAGI